MPIDFIAELRHLALPSRLKRLSDRLMGGERTVYRALGVEFEPCWLPIFSYLRSAARPASTTDISNALRLACPALIQATRRMVKKGLLQSSGPAADNRRHMLRLSPKGKRLAQTLEPIWQDFESAMTDLCEDSDLDGLAAIERIETELDQEEMDRRILLRIKQRQLDRVEVVDYRPEYRAHFRRLNLEWIRDVFEIEPADRRVLRDPEAEILGKGGNVLFAKIGDRVVGTCALLFIDALTFELAKMAVDPKHRGLQAGKKLLTAAIERAKSRGARTVVLRTDERLTAAVDLYRKTGFTDCAAEALPARRYRREAVALTMCFSLAGGESEGGQQKTD